MKKKLLLIILLSLVLLTTGCSKKEEKDPDVDELKCQTTQNIEEGIDFEVEYELGFNRVTKKITSAVMTVGYKATNETGRRTMKELHNSDIDICEDYDDKGVCKVIKNTNEFKAKVIYDEIGLDEEGLDEFSDIYDIKNEVEITLSTTCTIN